jgi:hypothetical protein
MEKFSKLLSQEMTDAEEAELQRELEEEERLQQEDKERDDDVTNMTKINILLTKMKTLCSAEQNKLAIEAHTKFLASRKLALRNNCEFAYLILIISSALDPHLKEEQLKKTVLNRAIRTKAINAEVAAAAKARKELRADSKVPVLTVEEKMDLLRLCHPEDPKDEFVSTWVEMWYTLLSKKDAAFRSSKEYHPQ